MAEGGSAMRTLSFLIEEAFAGQTVERFLLQNGISKRLLVKLKQTADGLVLDGVRTRSTTVLAAGQLLVVTPLQRRSGEAAEVPVLYEDDDLLVVDKPAGLPCHRSGGHQFDTLEQRIPFQPLRAVGRLDKETSGLVVLAKHQLAAARLHGTIEKTYLAVVAGEMPIGEGAIELPLLRKTPYEPLQIVDPAGFPALTVYRVVWAGECLSVALCTLPTGRMHQIRAHFSAIGHPLKGDVLYGGDCTRIGRQALHCARVEFLQPMQGNRLTFFSAVPADVRELLPQGALEEIDHGLGKRR